jgi:integrase
MDLKQQTLRQVLDNQAISFQARFDSFDMNTITDDQRKVRKNAANELNKIKNVKKNLAKSSVNILDTTMYDLTETSKGRAALLKVFTDSKIKTLKNGSEVKGPTQVIIAKLKQSFNDVGYKEQFFDAKNPTSNKTAIGQAFIENPDKKINATILKRLTVLANYYKNIKGQIKVTAYPNDFHVKMTGALKDLKGDFKTALGMQMYGGFRPGDLAGVDVSQIDLKRGIIHNVVLKSGGGTTVKDLIIGDAEKAILQNSINGRTSGPLYKIPQAQIDKVINQKIIDIFPDKINVRVHGVEGTKQLTQKYLRKSFTDLMAEMGHTLEDMEVKSGRADTRVIEGYMSDPVKMRRIQNISSDVAKSISGYTGHVSVGNGLASWGFDKNYVNKYAGNLPVTAYNMPNPQFTTYANQTFPKTYSIITTREPVNSFYSKPESKNNYIAPSGDSTEASKVAAMQNSLVQTKANQEYANLRASIAGQLGIKPEDMNVGDNEQLIDAEIERNENKLKASPKKKVDKPVKEATPVVDTKRAKVFQKVANLLGVDLGTSEGLQKVMQHIRNAKKAGNPLLSVSAGALLPLITAYTPEDEYASTAEKYKAIGAEILFGVTGLPFYAGDVGLGTKEQQARYEETKIPMQTEEEYRKELDEKIAQQQSGIAGYEQTDIEYNIGQQMQNMMLEKTDGNIYEQRPVKGYMEEE